VNRKFTGNAFGEGVEFASVKEWFAALQGRLRRVRVACGDWRRVLTDSVAFPSGVGGATGILLDPPYTDGNMDYAVGGTGGDVANAVREWAIANGDNPRLRIVLCGYDGEHAMPSGWTAVAWKASGGYSGGKRQHDERLWLSPHCLRSGRGQQVLL
jgi:hypothetical protein